jgi:hypothetical protein
MMIDINLGQAYRISLDIGPSHIIQCIHSLEILYMSGRHCVIVLSQEKGARHDDDDGGVNEKGIE